jgi:hypothetical protein
VKFFQNIWQDVRSGQNIDSYITIFIAVVIAILGITGIADEKIILSAVLATLAMVSTGLLVNRQENKRLSDAIANIENLDYLSDRFLLQQYDRDELHKRLRTSRQIFFWGITFTRTIPLLRDDIEYGIENGLQIRILLMKPSSSSVDMAAFRSNNSNVDDLNTDLRSNLSRLLNLASKNVSGKVEVRYVNYLPPYTITCCDPQLINGHMFVRLSSFRVPNQIRPTFELTSANDKYWFNFFVEQFESVWREAESVDPNHIKI